MSPFRQDRQCVSVCTGTVFMGIKKQRLVSLCKDTAFVGSEALSRMVRCAFGAETGIVAHQVLHFIVGTGVNTKGVLLKLLSVLCRLKMQVKEHCR